MSTFSDYLIYDERNERMLHSRYLNRGQYYDIFRLSFHTLRPDLAYYTADDEGRYGRLATMIQGHLRSAHNESIKMCYELHKTDYPGEHCYPLLKNTMNFMFPAIGSAFFRRVTDWTDAQKSRNYVNKVAYKIEMFGLHYPLVSSTYTTEQVNDAEEELYQFFMEQFRKPKQAPETATEAS